MHNHFHLPIKQCGLQTAGLQQRKHHSSSLLSLCQVAYVDNYHQILYSKISSKHHSLSTIRAQNAKLIESMLCTVPRSILGMCSANGRRRYIVASSLINPYPGWSQSNSHKNTHSSVWSLFPRFKSTMFHHWFRWWLVADQATSRYMNQWWQANWRPHLVSTEIGMEVTLETSLYFDKFLLRFRIYCSNLQKIS